MDLNQIQSIYTNQQTRKSFVSIHVPAGSFEQVLWVQYALEWQQSKGVTDYGKLSCLKSKFIKLHQEYIDSSFHWSRHENPRGCCSFLGDCKKVHKHYIASTILANWDTWQLVGPLPNNPHFHKLQPVHFFSTRALGERSLPFIELLDNDPAQWQLRTVLVAKLAPICQISSSGSFSDQIRGLSHPP